MIALGSSMKSDGFHEELSCRRSSASPSLAHFWLSALLYPALFTSGYYAYRQRHCGAMIGLSLIKVGIIDFGGGFAAKAAVRSAITNISALVYWF